MMSTSKRPFALIILDGWGIAPESAGNAISLAHPTHIDHLWDTYPHGELQAAGAAVGLPPNENGNSETGHITLGAGRIVEQDVIRISHEIENGKFFENQALQDAFSHAKSNNSNVHIMGLFSKASVHASYVHLKALIEMAKREHASNVYLHLFTDGRDTLPKSALSFILEFEKDVLKDTSVHIATLMGRYYAMDRDRRWERTEIAYDALTSEGGVPTFPTAHDAIQASYDAGITDEFIKPAILTDVSGNPYPRICAHDSVIFFNYRIDRPRQLARALVVSDFESKRYSASFGSPTLNDTEEEHDQRHIPFTRKIKIADIHLVTLTEYEPSLPAIPAYPPQHITNGIGETLAKAGATQLRVSESEKERFVTYYFNGLQKEPFDNEKRLIIPSSLVATYDLEPQMSAIKMTESVINTITNDSYDALILNYANPDMVGHTGNIQKAVIACQTVDSCVGTLIDFLLSKNFVCIITADHGNAEQMLTMKNEMETEHSANPVPCILIASELKGSKKLLKAGTIGDVGPTLLSYADYEVPQEMSENNLYTR